MARTLLSEKIWVENLPGLFQGLNQEEYEQGTFTRHLPEIFGHWHVSEEVARTQETVNKNDSVFTFCANTLACGVNVNGEVVSYLPHEADVDFWRKG